MEKIRKVASIKCRFCTKKIKRNSRIWYPSSDFEVSPFLFALEPASCPLVFS
jgi:hypothetical protein